MEHENRYRLRILTIVFAIVGTGVLGIILLPSILLGPSAFFNKPVYSSLSPDGSTEIVIYRKVSFPASEIIDPSITVTVEVKSPGALKARNYVQFNLYEFSDLTGPNIEWLPDTVRVSDIKYRKQYEFLLNYK